MAKEGEIKLGMKVKDVVTDVEGIAVVVSDHWHGATRIEIQQQKNKDGVVPETRVADEAQVEVLSKKPILEVPKIKPPRFKFGAIVEDPISGYSGAVIGRAIFLNGCVRVHVQAHRDNYLEGSESHDNGTWFPEEILEDLEGSIIETKNEKHTEQPAKRTGGPASRPTREPRPRL